jgi:hypothetical protein
MSGIVAKSMISHLDHILTFLSLAAFAGLIIWWFNGGKQ